MRFLWAQEIRAEDAGDHIRVVGRLRFDNDAMGLLRRYGKPSADKGAEGEAEKESPLMRFANASSRAELIRFVGDFGPVVAEEPPEPIHSDDVEIKHATQSWKDLESEHRLFQSLLRLLQIVRGEKAEEELRSSQPVFDEVLGCTSEWITQCQHESSIRRLSKKFAPIAWNWTKDQQAALGRRLDDVRNFLEADDKLVAIFAHGDPITNVNQAICEVLDAFRICLQFLNAGPGQDPRVVELPRSDLDFGIRPLLYFMLRTDYLNGWERRLCGRIGCGTWFTPTGHRPHHCSALCARKVRQKNSWERKGRETRRARTLKAREASTNKQTGPTKGNA